MLTKLLKYDLKYVYKVLVVFYILALIFALLTRVFSIIENSALFYILSKICSGTVIAFIFNILINNILRLWARFVKNIYGDESYLTHTLPVEKKKIYLSKFLSSVITMFTSVFVILIVLFVAYFSKGNFDIIKSMLDSIALSYNSSSLILVLVLFLIFFIEMAFSVQVGYVGILLGHRSTNNRMAKSVIYGFICYMLAQALSLFIVFIIGMFNKDVMNLFITDGMINLNIVKLIMLFAIILYGIYLFAYYLIGLILFEKGLDVE